MKLMWTTLLGRIWCGMTCLMALVLLMMPGLPATGAGLAGVGYLALPEEKLLGDPVFARSGFADLALPYLHKTRYLLSLDVNPASGHIEGNARVLFVNETTQPLYHIVFRQYPNHPRDSVRDGVFHRRMSIRSVSVTNQTVRWQVRDLWETVLDIPLSSTLAPAGTVSVDIAYSITTTPGQNFFSPTEVYPLLAVYDPDVKGTAGPGTGAWREDVATKSLDLVFSESSLYAIRLRAPAEFRVISTGVIKESHSSTDRPGLVEYAIVTGPVREYIFALARDWEEIMPPGAPVPVHVYHQGNRQAAETIASTAAAAMHFYDDHFGAYPYAQFDVIAMPYSTGGEEYPALVFCNTVGKHTYFQFITAHEVAHQWFYGVAGNDIIRHAWLDESLAQISGYLYYVDQYGAAAADREYWPHILIWSNRSSATPPLIDTSLEGFKDASEYMSTIYGQGAVFLRDLATQMGSAAFMAGLREYYQTVYFGVGTPPQFFAAMQAQTDLDLHPIFCTRVGVACKSR